MSPSIAHRTRPKAYVLAFVPLMLLVGAWLATNAGFGVAKPAHAANVTVSATVSSGTWSESNNCANAISVAVATNLTSFAGGTCDVTFGITNAASNLFVQAQAGFWNQGSAYYSNFGGAACGASLAARDFGFKVGTAAEGRTGAVVGAGCAEEVLPADGVAAGSTGSEWRAIPISPTAAVNACDTASQIGTRVCPIHFGVVSDNGTTTVPAATYSGVLQFTAS